MRMLQMGMAIEQVMAITKLAQDEVERLVAAVSS